MNKKVVLPLVAMLTIFIIFGAGMYYASTKLEFELKSIDEIKLSNNKLTVEMTMKVTNPTVFLAYIDGGSYKLYIDGTFIGAGEFGSLFLGKGQEDIKITQNIENVPLSMIGKIFNVLQGTDTFIIKIELESVQFFGISMNLDYEVEMQYPEE